MSVWNTNSGSFSLGIGRQIIALLIIGIVSFGIVLLAEYYLKRLGLAWESLRTKWSSSNRAADLRAPEGEDEDVQAERTRVKCEIQKLSKDSAVVTTNLRKCYGPKVAVQNLTLGRCYFDISPGQPSINLYI
eukprot:sb/3474998/